MQTDQEKALDKFARSFEFLVDELENYSGYLKLTPETEKLRDEALGILKKKAKKIERADGKKDLKKILKVEKILEKEGLQ